MSCCCCWWWLLAIPVVYQVIKRFLRKPITPNCYDKKVVVVTGASSGIGEELALQYAKLGATVVISARRAELLQKLKEKIEDLYKSDVQIVVCDVSLPNDCQRLIQEVITKQGRVDTLVLNAGVAGGNMLLDEFPDLTKHREIMDTNYWGCVAPAFHALPHLKSSHGQIVVVSSLASFNASLKRTAYSPTKSALNSFFDCLRLELKGLVRVTVACPGFVETQIHDSIMQKQNLKRNLKIFMTSQECARQIIESGHNADSLFVMTGSARFLYTVRGFVPLSLLDFVVTRSSSAAFSAADTKKTQ